MNKECIILLVWLFSLPILWKIKHWFSKNIETQARFFIAYTITTIIVLLFWIGKTFISDTDFLLNLTTEIIGIGITVFLIDRVYQYVNSKNEQLYRKLALRTCRMPIYTYCAFWLGMLESDTGKISIDLTKYKSLEDLFLSDEFRNKVNSFDFNKYIAIDTTYAQYYEKKMNEVKDRFQSVLAKYASKLSRKDLLLLEHFGGRAYFYTVFVVMKFISEAKFTSQFGNESAKEIKPFNNNFRNISKENFHKHFHKLIELINEYNGSVENDYEKWTIENINKLQTIESANNNSATEW